MSPLECRSRVSLLLALVCVLAGCGLIMRQGVIAYIAVSSQFDAKRIEIEINKSFIDDYKDRVAINATFTVDKAMPFSLPGELDGDLHFAGRSPQITLPVVAEIANAGDARAKPAVDMVHAAEGTGKTLLVSGVWRIWPEHAGTREEEQGKPVGALSTFSPDHIFEIHPVTEINGLVLLDSFTPVSGFHPGDARSTFSDFEKISCTLRVKHRTVSLVVDAGLANGVDFIMKLTDDPPLVMEDGRFVFASAGDLDGKPIVQRLRMVFAKGTPPELAVRSLKGGDSLHVLGLPRVNFAEIAQRVAGHEADPSLLTRPLPYEIVILAVFPH
jgi:hypothetical protein